MSVVARRYAQALFSLCSDAKLRSKIAAEAETLLSWADECPDFTSFMSNRFLKDSEALAVFRDLSEKASFSETMTSFLLVMAEKRRLSFLTATLRVFLKLIDNASGIVRGKVTTALKMTKSDVTKISKILSHKLEKKIELTSSIDPKILGGVILRVGPYLIDSSLETRLSSLETRLKG